jgi:hypothetical protein
MKTYVVQKRYPYIVKVRAITTKRSAMAINPIIPKIRPAIAKPLPLSEGSLFVLTIPIIPKIMAKMGKINPMIAQKDEIKGTAKNNTPKTKETRLASSITLVSSGVKRPNKK